MESTDPLRSLAFLDALRRSVRRAAVQVENFTLRNGRLGSAAGPSKDTGAG